MKTLIHPLLCLILLPLIAQAETETEKDCYNMSDQALICTYKGETGLELLPTAKPHQIQRLAFSFGDTMGSIVLVKNAQIEGFSFNECWSVSHSLKKELLLFCKQEMSPYGTIPKIIINEVENLRAK